MKKITVEMPEVLKCSVSQCAYNQGNACHAKAITVGDHSLPNCDTFCAIASHVQNAAQQAGVGACKVIKCRFNRDLECTVDSVQVATVNNQAQCQTFRS